MIASSCSASSLLNTSHDYVQYVLTFQNNIFSNKSYSLPTYGNLKLIRYYYSLKKFI